MRARGAVMPADLSPAALGSDPERRVGRSAAAAAAAGGHASFEAKARAAASGSVASPVSRARERRHATPRGVAGHLCASPVE